MNGMNNGEIEDSAEMSFQSYDLVCLSHLRWDFVYQRPQHLMSRFARQRRVFFVEEAIIHDEATHFAISQRDDKLRVVVPHLNRNEVESVGYDNLMSEKINEFFSESAIKDCVLWYYTPMALAFADKLKPKTIVYDCMDELSLFKFAPPELIKNEARLFQQANVVFTGGQSLYEAKRRQHKNVRAFPSSIDVAHFKQARNVIESPSDQSAIPSPILGYIGVIDERIDIELIGEIADKRPEWQIVMIGPVVKIDDQDLPQNENIHYLGMKDYKDLPRYIAGWDVALMPFAINDSTKFISPTKTPEYLAAGKPVISTAIQDVVRPYGEQNLVAVAGTSDEFIAAAEAALKEDRTEKIREVDKFLMQTSWDKTFKRMSDLIDESIAESSSLTAHSTA